MPLMYEKLYYVQRKCSPAACAAITHNKFGLKKHQKLKQENIHLQHLLE